MRYAAIGIGVVLVSLSGSFAREVVDDIVPSASLGIGHDALAPLDEAPEVGSMVQALPPDLPAALSGEGAPSANPTGRASSKGERDPFRPFTLDLQPKKVAEDAFLTPLQRYDLQQLTVVGVLLDLEPPRAMVQDDAGMGYIVTPGTLIGRQSGIVTDVQPRQVIVEETYVDFYGREQVRRAILEMSDEEIVMKKKSRKRK